MLGYDSAMSTGKLKLIRIIACVDGNAEEALTILDGTTNLIPLPFGHRVPIRSRSTTAFGPMMLDATYRSRRIS
jgi:hypothetical protein